MVTRNWGFLINKLGEIMILVTWLVTRFIFKLYRLPESLVVIIVVDAIGVMSEWKKGEVRVN